MPALRHAALSLAIVILATGAEAAKVPVRAAERAQREGSVRVLVELDETVAPEGSLAGRSAVARQRARIATGARRLARSLGGSGTRIVRSFETVPYVALDADPAGLATLEGSDLVRSVEEDRLAFPVLLESVALIEADAAHLSGYEGSGEAIAILDTGVDADHPFLAGKVVSEACFSSNGNCPDGTPTQFGTGAGAPCAYAPEGCGHGTHVAGIAAGDDENAPGVAPGADVISIQIFSRFDGAVCAGGPSPCAASFTSDQLAALERVLTLTDTFPIAAVNMSIGGTTPYATSAACDIANAARKTAIDHLRSVGVATVVAAGNEGFTSGLTSPSCISSAVSVGATTDADAVAGFSNSASFLTLLAPGVDIVSSQPGGVFGSMSGTSMAAPHVSGAFAVLREPSPSASVTDLVDRLVSTGVPVTDPRNGLVFRRISLFDAVASTLEASLGLLEHPLDGSFAGGIGAFTAWVCDATSVLIRVDGGAPMVAAYGTPRNDTIGVCGDADNGVSLLYNFNRDGDGTHTAELIADGAVVSTSTYNVSTFGVPFLTDADAKSYVLENFEGHDVTVKWLVESQRFEITSID